MATTNALVLTLGYRKTDFTRKYRFTDVEASSLSNVKAKIQAYNAAIPEIDKKIFISDDYDDMDDDNIIGTFTGITAAQYETVVETKIE